FVVFCDCFVFLLDSLACFFSVFSFGELFFLDCLEPCPFFSALVCLLDFVSVSFSLFFFVFFFSCVCFFCFLSFFLSFFFFFLFFFFFFFFIIFFLFFFFCFFFFIFYYNRLLLFSIFLQTCGLFFNKPTG